MTIRSGYGPPIVQRAAPRRQTPASSRGSRLAMALSAQPPEAMAEGPQARGIQLAGAMAPLPAEAMVDQGSVRRKAIADALDAGMTGPIQGDGSGWDWAQALVRGGEAFFRARSARDDRQEQGVTAIRERRKEDDAEREKTQQKADLENWIGTLDPSQQAIARVNPSAAATVGAERAFARPEQVVQGGFVWTQNPDGTLTRGEAVPLNAAQNADLQVSLAAARRAGQGSGEMIDSRKFSQGQSLADDFRMQTKDYQTIADTGALAANYARQLQSGQRDPSMEGALLMKIAGGLQSGVLSDNDIRTASGGTLPTNVMSLVDTTTGRGRLSQQQISGLLNVARLQDERARQRVQGYVDNVRGIAQARGIPENYIFGVDPMQTMFPAMQAAQQDDTQALLEELRSLKGAAPAPGGVAGFRNTMPGQPGGYTGR